MYRGIACTLIGLLLVASCGGELTTDEHEEIVPKAKRDYSFQPEDTVVSKMEVPKDFEHLVAFASSEAAELSQFDSSLYVNRFGPTQQFNFLRASKSDTTEWYIYQFTDSLKTLNAFYNWLDCFGSDCQSLSVGQESKIKGRPGFVWVSQQWIIVILVQYGKPVFDKTFWNEVIDEEEHLFYLNWKKNGKLTWWMAEEITPKP